MVEKGPQQTSIGKSQGTTQSGIQNTGATLKLISKDTSNQRGSETDEEIDLEFSGMAHKNDVKNLETGGLDN